MAIAALPGAGQNPAYRPSAPLHPADAHMPPGACGNAPHHFGDGAICELKKNIKRIYVDKLTVWLKYDLRNASKQHLSLHILHKVFHIEAKNPLESHEIP
jgi:hypothetical protein